jgi:hypothetical protein
MALIGCASKSVINVICEFTKSFAVSFFCSVEKVAQWFAILPIFSRGCSLLNAHFLRALETGALHHPEAV